MQPHMLYIIIIGSHEALLAGSRNIKKELDL